MTNMIGRSPGLNTISGLIEVLKNPDAVKGHIAQIQKAEDAHRESVKVSTMELKKRKEELDQQNAQLTEREKAIKLGEQKLAQGVIQLQTDQTALAQTKAAFEKFEKATSMNLSDREVALEKKEQDAAKKIAAVNDDLAKRTAAVVKAEAAVKSAETAIAAREKSVAARDADVTARETRLREVFK